MPHDKNNIERMETAMEVYDRFQPLKKAHPHTRLTAAEALQVEPGLTPDLIGAVTMEEWGVDPHRLVFANVQDAIAHGARALKSHPGGRPCARWRQGDRGSLSRVGRRHFRGSREGRRERCRPVVPEISRMAGADVQLRPAKAFTSSIRTAYRTSQSAPNRSTAATC